MRKKLLVTFGCLCSLVGFTQNDCAEAIKLGQTYMMGTSTTKPDYAKAYATLQNCVSQGDPKSLAISAEMLLAGMGVEKNEQLAFEYMKKAADQKYGYAEYRLGLYYRQGIGCPVDLVRSLVSLANATLHGNEEAGYYMGYIALKGQGVGQNYEAAFSWLERSQNPMAKYWLSYCHYFGYGVPKDTNKAIEYCNQSDTPASKQLLKHIAENAKEKLAATIDSQLNEAETAQNTAIAPEAIEKVTIETPKQTENKTLKSKYLNGKWKGKLIELEWSGKQITQILPVSCELEAQDDKNLNCKWEINNTTSQVPALWIDNGVYFKQLHMVLDLPLSDNPNVNTIDWHLLSAQVEFKTINDKTYLIGNLKTYTQQWKEPGPPMRVILKQVEEGEEDDFTSEELLAISQQKEHFIVLYPNPFVSNVLISYALETDAQVSVKVYDLNGNPLPATLEPGAMQTAGEHHYTLDGTGLKPGMYIVQVTVNDQTYSRIVIKQ